MKHKYLLFICLLALGFMACKKENTGKSAPIAGTWNLNKFNRQDFKDGVKISDTTIFITPDLFSLYYLQLNADSTGKTPVVQPGPYPMEFTYTVKGSSLVLVNDTYAYKMLYTIKKLTKAELELQLVFYDNNNTVNRMVHSYYSR